MTRLAALATFAVLAGAAGAGDILPTATILHPEPVAGDEFGATLAATGSYLCVGAPERAGGGAFYVFEGETYAFRGRIDAPAGANGGKFPFRLAGVGDSRLAATEYFSRTAHLFDLPSRTLITTLADPDNQSGGFGYSVAANNSVLAVGDIFEDSPPNANGRIQLYNHSGVYLRTIEHPNQTGGGASFPSSMQITEDTIYAGSIYSRVNPTQGSGEGYAIRLSDGVPIAAYPDATSGQNLLGATVALTSHGLAVGPGYDDGLPYGYLYIFAGTDPAPRVTIRSPGLSNASFNDRFGSSTAVAADGSLLIGTPGGPWDAPTDRRAQGLVYAHSPLTGELRDRLLTPLDAPSFGQAGMALAVRGETVFVGAPGTESSPSDTGRVYVYRVENPVRGHGILVR